MLKDIRSDKELNKLPVIMLSAKADIEMRIKGIEGGANDYIPKPFNKKELKLKSEFHICRGLRGPTKIGWICSDGVSKVGEKDFSRRGTELHTEHILFYIRSLYIKAAARADKYCTRMIWRGCGDAIGR